MPHDVSLITTIAAALGFGLIFGMIAVRFKLPALVGYLAITFVYYWWHRARHQSDVLWRVLHQLHHSPARLELAATSNEILVLLFRGLDGARRGRERW